MKRFLNYLKTQPVALVSLIILTLLYLTMIFAEFFAPYSPNTSFPDKSYHPPNAKIYQGGLQAQEFRVTNTVTWKYARVRNQYEPIRFFGKGEPYRLCGVIPLNRHFINTQPGAGPVFLMGADNLGRDIFSRIIYGSRISLTIGFVATAISLALAAIAGGLAGYFGGAADWSIMRAAEFLMLIPGLYLILFLRSLMASNMDSGQSYMMITIILSLIGWPGSARTIRGMVHAIKREEFVLNARLEMIPAPIIIMKHIIPQIASLLIVSVALSVPGFIMTETVLSYLGLGITDPAVSWGSLIKRDVSTLANLRAYPWLLNPVWFLLGVTLAFNFIGDSLRDYFDPFHAVFARKKKFWIRSREKQAGGQSTESNGQSAPNEKQHSALLAVTGLSVRFTVLRGREHISVQAVRGLSYDVRKGECLGIVGESGSGKSVSSLAVLGLLPKNATLNGSIVYEGNEIAGLKTEALRQYRGKKIGMIFQEPGRSYDPLQNMSGVFYETLKNSEPKISKEDAAARAETLLAETGLRGGKERLSNFPHQFSGGQLQRIGIALALAQGCELLIADEPTTALDVTIQKQIIALLRALKASRNISIIFISHDIDLVAEISDRIMVMYGGMAMESGPVKDILNAPLHPYTRALLAASPAFGSHYSREKLLTIPGKVPDPVQPEPGCPFAPRCTRAQSECSRRIPELQTDTHNGQLRECRCIGISLCMNQETLSS